MTERRSELNPETFRQQRLALLTGPGGSLSMIAMPAITSTPQTFDGLPGVWSCPDASAAGVSVTVSKHDNVQIIGHQLEGTDTARPGAAPALLRHSDRPGLPGSRRHLVSPGR